MNRQDPKLTEAVETMTPFVDEMMRRFNEERAKLPTPPPGYFYVPELKDARFEGDRCVVDMAIKLQPIIHSEE